MAAASDPVVIVSGARTPLGRMGETAFTPGDNFVATWITDDATTQHAGH